MKLVEKSVCFECGDRVLARVSLPMPGMSSSATLTCPECGATWQPHRPIGVGRSGAVDVPDDVPTYYTRVYVGAGHTIVSVGGDIDISTAVRFRDTALAAIDDEPRRVVADLTEVTFMDSTGVAVLVLMRRRTTARGVQLAVVSNPRLDTMLHVSGLDQAFEVHPTLEDAIGSPGRPADAQDAAH